MLEVEDLTKEYATPAGPLSILRGIQLRLDKGEALSVMGPSGGGKSTLLFVLGALEPPTSGSVRLDGSDPFTLDDQGLSRFRNEKVGFVFQDHCLLPQCSVLENVLIPTLVAPNRGSAQSGVDAYRAKAEELLERVGLSHRLDHRPGELSGGEQQRVAIARALIREPTLVLCDEPTGNLDGETARSVASLLLELHEGGERILLIVTHSLELAERCPRQMELKEGVLRARTSSGRAGRAGTAT